MAGGDAADDDPSPDVPEWDDEYVDRVSGRLMHSYDLERDRRVQGRTFTLYGRLDVESRKQFIHPAITYGHHESTEHVFVRRADRVSVDDLEDLAALGNDLGEEWVDPDEEHYATEFVFVVLAPEITDRVREFVTGFRSRTLLKGGYYGHYAVRLAVVAPDREDLVASPDADVATAFQLWEEKQGEGDGVLGRLRSALSRRS